MKLRASLASILIFTGLHHITGLPDFNHAPYYASNQTHIASYEDELWPQATLNQFKKANIILQFEKYENAYAYEVGPQFYRLNDNDKLSVVSALDASINPEQSTYKTAFIMDCYTQKQIGTYSAQEGLILH